MSDLNDLINKIKVRNSSRNENRVKFLPYIPSKPNTKQVCKNELKTKKQKVPLPVPPKQDESEMWKVNWLIEYDAARRQMEAQKQAIFEKSKENEILKESNESQKKLVCEFAKRLKQKNTIIQELINNFPTIEQPNGQQDTSTQTENETQTRETATEQTHEEATAQTEEQSEIDATTFHDDDAIQFEEVCVATNPKKPSVLYLCPNCDYSTTKKSTIDDHLAEFCKTEALKTMECKICYKKFTRRGLRIHFNNFCTGKHNPRNEHAEFSCEDHEIFKVAAMYGFEYP